MSELNLEQLLENLPPHLRKILEDRDEDALERLESTVSKSLEQWKILKFKPTPKQLEFVTASSSSKQVLLRAGNRTGKSEIAAVSIAAHLTGIYPDWWTGRRFKNQIDAIALSVSAESTRDILQEKLIGPSSRREDWGTGFIPKSHIDFDSIVMRAGTPNAIDTINIKNANGKWSTLKFKAASQGRDKLQGITIDLAWIDEECEIDIYTEVATRLATTAGQLLMTWTPLGGMTQLVNHWENDDTRPGIMVKATLYDATFMTKEKIDALIASWPEHERPARIEGIPFLGSGLVFLVKQEEITVNPFDIPGHWKQIAGIDLGLDHPFAAVKIAFDPEADIGYVVAEYRIKDAPPVVQAAGIKSWGVPIAWPHDTNRRAIAGEKESLPTFRKMYEDAGLDMLNKHAQAKDGGNSLELSITDIHQRFKLGKLKIFTICGMLLEEIRYYSRRDGKIHPINDDLIAAMRYAIMMERYAAIPNSRNNGWNYNHSGPLRRNLSDVI